MKRLSNTSYDDSQPRDSDSCPSVTAASRARIAASKWLVKQPPSDTSIYSPPAGPRSNPPFATPRSTRNVCVRTVALDVVCVTCWMVALKVVVIVASQARQYTRAQFSYGLGGCASRGPLGHR